MGVERRFHKGGEHDSVGRDILPVHNDHEQAAGENSMGHFQVQIFVTLSSRPAASIRIGSIRSSRSICVLGKRRSSVPAKNLYHDSVVEALIADGWTITHDPLTLAYGGKDLFVDLGAERETIAAEKDNRRIAVEIQSFLNPSIVRDLEEAVGQFEVYRTVLETIEPERVLYLAIPSRVSNAILAESFGQLIVSRLKLQLFVFDEQSHRVIQWTN
jgi:hypothetical protein